VRATDSAVPVALPTAAPRRPAVGAAGAVTALGGDGAGGIAAGAGPCFTEVVPGAEGGGAEGLVGAATVGVEDVGVEGVGVGFVGAGLAGAVGAL
jgi:hypothetical protein